MASILISYRRADSEAIAGRIHDRLAMYFGVSSIFMDIDDIPLGADFRHTVAEQIRKRDFVLVIVGPKWRGQRDGGPARISDPSDPVRAEVEAALAHRRQTIPVLVGGALMPSRDEVPGVLVDFCYLNAATVDAGVDFHNHMARLIRQIVRLDPGSRSMVSLAMVRMTKNKKVAGSVAAAAATALISVGGAYAHWDRLFPRPAKSAAVFMMPPPHRLVDDTQLKEQVFRTVWSHFFSGLAAQKKFDVVPTRTELLDGSSNFRRSFYGPEIAGRVVLAEGLATYGETISRRIEFVARCDVYPQGDNVRLIMALEAFDGDRRLFGEIKDARTEVSGRRSSAEVLALIASYQLIAKFLPLAGLSSPAAEETVASEFLSALRTDPIRSQLVTTALPKACGDFACMQRVADDVLETTKGIDQTQAAQKSVSTAVEANRLARGTSDE